MWGKFVHLLLRLGALAVVLAVSPFLPFELDRFFVPKELVLHVAAVLAALVAFRALRERTTATLDRYLAAYLALGALSAALAPNRWLALRALAISASSVLLFWSAAAMPPLSDRRRPFVRFAVIAAALTSLLQTYGMQTIFFSENRVPGGTLGNRNFIAHVAAFGLPVVLLAALQAQRRGAVLLGALGAAITTASLVLTRSRAAWLAFAAVALLFVVAMLASPVLRRDGRTWRRLFAVAALTTLGVAAALLLPNTLRWREKNPYLTSVRRVADYEEGSGRGRLVQYKQSLWLAARHPLLGTGPGNWAVEYPAHAARNDPSLSDTDAGMTTNPWPSSDWVAWTAERGLPAVVLMALVFLALAMSGVRQLFAAPDVDGALAATALLGTVAGAAVTGLFDAVLLLAVPAFLVWTALGALLPTPTAPPTRRPLSALVIVAVIALAAAGAARSAAQLAAMQIYTTHGDRAALTHAARIDPGNYRLQLRLARMGGRGRCEHARAAHALYPSASAAAELSRGCR